MRLLLIRHGQTPSNLLGALDTGVPGPPLTELGREQAEVVRDELVDCGVEAIYVSSMQRTHETAAPTAAALGLPVLARDGLREISAGELEMRSDDAAIERYLEFMTACARGEADELPGGETSAAVIARFDAVVEELAAGGAAVVVAFSHGAVLRAWTGLRADNLNAEFTLEHSLRNTGTIVLDGSPAAAGPPAPGTPPHSTTQACRLDRPGRAARPPTERRPPYGRPAPEAPALTLSRAGPGPCRCRSTAH